MIKALIALFSKAAQKVATAAGDVAKDFGA
jgi:hypothetical protein